MSKVTISGNASGTGTLLIAAPNTNSDITLNLPTTMGTNNSSSVVTTDAAGNLGLGVTPSAWGGGYKAIEILGYLGLGVAGGTSQFFTNSFYNGSNYIYRNTAAASFYAQSAGSHIWSTAPSGTAGNTISFTQAMTLDASGNLLVGKTSATYSAAGRGLIEIAGASTALLELKGGTSSHYVYNDGGSMQITVSNAGNILFKTSDTERARIDSSGNWTVGSNGGTNRALVANPQYTESVGWNGAVTSVWIGKNNSSGRSVSAAGTLNASGADYAEYMTKAGEFTIVKGDVVGINTDGKLTNVFADAVSFCVKSTDPSYVGGDSWGSGFEDDAEGLEAARQRVDRIAFAGQVPVNVTGATAGQYIVPVNDNGAIKGEAVSNPTFEQYQQAVGKVIALEADGRARIIVKVA